MMIRSSVAQRRSRREEKHSGWQLEWHENAIPYKSSASQESVECIENRLYRHN